MAIEMQCECGKQFQVKDEHAGMRGKCPACGSVLAIPVPRDAGIPSMSQGSPGVPPKPPSFSTAMAATVLPIIFAVACLAEAMVVRLDRDFMSDLGLAVRQFRLVLLVAVAEVALLRQ